MNDSTPTEQFQARIIKEEPRTHVVYYLKPMGDGLGRDEDLYLDGYVEPTDVLPELPSDAYMFSMYRQLVVTITSDDATFNKTCVLHVRRDNDVSSTYYPEAQFVSYDEAVQQGYRPEDHPLTCYVLDKHGMLRSGRVEDVAVIKSPQTATTG